MIKRIVHVAACMMDDEAEKLATALMATGEEGLILLATEINYQRRKEPKYIVVMNDGWETPRAKQLRDSCDVEGCSNLCDKDSVNSFCTVHDERGCNSEENWDRIP